MKVIILAGGFGTRLSEYTNDIPKPMVPIGEYPIIWHIMKIFARFNFKDFYCALGYKSELIKEYFYKQRILNSDFSIDLASGDINFHKSNNINWNVTLINTGIKSMTGGRVKRMKKNTLPCRLLALRSKILKEWVYQQEIMKLEM